MAATYVESITMTNTVVAQVTLRLLELSQISMPVAMLRNNASAEVATLAKTLAKRWRELAVAALDCATKALERRA